MTPEKQKLHNKLKRIDNWLYRLDVETLWYAYTKIEKILYKKAEKEKKS